MALTDQSTRIRDGEELDASLIDPYLKALRAQLDPRGVMNPGALTES